jgi:hypothetical protein
MVAAKTVDLYKQIHECEVDIRDNVHYFLDWVVYTLFYMLKWSVLLCIFMLNVSALYVLLLDDMVFMVVVVLCIWLFYVYCHLIRTCCTDCIDVLLRCRAAA